MADTEDEGSSSDGHLRRALDALRDDDQYKKLIKKPWRTQDQALLCTALRKLAFDLCGGDWAGFLQKRAELNGDPPLTPEQIEPERRSFSCDLNGRREYPFPKQKAVNDIFRVALRDAKPYEREAALSPIRYLWKTVTGAELNLPTEQEQNTADNGSADDAEDARHLIMAAVAAQNRAETARRQAEDEAFSLAVKLAATAADRDSLAEQIARLETERDQLTQDLRRARTERDDQQRAAKAALAERDHLRAERDQLTRERGHYWSLADGRAERFARLVAHAEELGLPLDRKLLAHVGLTLKVFAKADRNHRAICAYLQIRLQLIRHDKTQPKPLPPGINAEMLERTYDGQGSLPSWKQFVAVVESLGGQQSFLEPFYNKVKAEETPVDPLNAQFLSIVADAGIPGLVEVSEPDETRADQKPRSVRRFRVLLRFLRRRKKTQPEQMEASANSTSPREETQGTAVRSPSSASESKHRSDEQHPFCSSNAVTKDQIIAPIYREMEAVWYRPHGQTAATELRRDGSYSRQGVGPMYGGGHGPGPVGSGRHAATAPPAARVYGSGTGSDSRPSPRTVPPKRPLDWLDD